MRVTGPMLKVLHFLLSTPGQQAYGLEIMAATGIKSGTLYPLLHRLGDAGLLESSREAVDPSLAGRPARTYFRLSGAGAHEARRIVLDHAGHGAGTWAW